MTFHFRDDKPAPWECPWCKARFSEDALVDAGAHIYQTPCCASPIAFHHSDVFGLLPLKWIDFRPEPIAFDLRLDRDLPDDLGE